MPDESPFDEHAERARRQERERHRDEEVNAEQRGQELREEIRSHPGDVGAQNHELAMGHVDDAHLAEDDREAERHQQED